MQPFPVPYEPTPLTPCQTLRSRLEKSTRDSVNVRHVELWQTDAPSLTQNRKPIGRAAYYEDMLPIASRTYAEDMNQWVQYEVPSRNPTRDAKEREEAEKTLRGVYDIIQRIDMNTSKLVPGSTQWNALKAQRLEAQNRAQEARDLISELDANTLTENPYFDRFDLASDPRNVIRELNAVVSEDKVDRGIREAKQMLGRTFQNRWVDQSEVEQKGYDALNAYELMRPRLNEMSFEYRAAVPATVSPPATVQGKGEGRR